MSYKNNTVFIKTRESIIWFIDLFYPIFKPLMPIQTFRYAACGGTVTLLGLLSYFLIYNYVLDSEYISFFGFSMTRYIAAFVGSFCISFPVGFFLSKFVVFSESQLKGRIQLFRYLVLQFLNILLNWSLLHFFVGFLEFWATPSQVITTVILAVFSYFFQRNVSFKTVKDKDGIPLKKMENEIDQQSSIINDANL